MNRTLSVGVMLILLFMTSATHVNADGMTALALEASPEQTRELERQLEELISEGAARGKEKIKELSDETETQNEVAEKNTLLKPVVTSDVEGKARHKQLRNLLNEVDSLRDQVVVAHRTGIATQRPRNKRSIGTKTVFDWKEGDIYTIHTALHRVTDIELGRGEALSNPPMAGDNLRWKFTSFESGVGAERRVHILVKPQDEAIETNVILSTNKRTYHLRVLSSDQYMPSVRWNYEEENMREITRKFQAEREVEPLAVTPDKLNWNYTVEKSDHVWRPVRVYDDGARTYIQFSPRTRVMEKPALFLLDRDGNAQVANWVSEGDMYYVRRLFERAELRLGKGESIEIRSDRYKPSFWEKIF